MGSRSKTTGNRQHDAKNSAPAEEWSEEMIAWFNRPEIPESEFELEIDRHLDLWREIDLEDPL